MVPLVGNIYTIGTNLIANGTIGKEIGENGHTIGTNVTNVTNQMVQFGVPRTHAMFYHLHGMVHSLLFTHFLASVINSRDLLHEPKAHKVSL